MDRNGGQESLFSWVARRTAAAAVMSTLLVAGPASAAGTDAKGTVVYKGRTTTVKNAYLVIGPDQVTKAPVRRLILTPLDLGAKIAACTKFSCTDDGLTEGLEVDLVPGSRFNFWLVQNDQKIQYSGTAELAALVAKVNDGKQLSGTLKLDQSSSGGPKIDVEFDAALVKAFVAP